jgi:hypothetical protein
VRHFVRDYLEGPGNPGALPWAVGRDLVGPVEQLGVDSIALDQLAEAVPARPAAPVALDVKHVELADQAAEYGSRLRAASQPPLDPQRALRLRRCSLNVSPFPDPCGRQKQLGCQIRMRSRLAPRPQEPDEVRRVLPGR